jgi:hypothetical protein
LTHTLRGIRNLADYLQMHPEVLVFGKQKSAIGSGVPAEKETRR